MASVSRPVWLKSRAGAAYLVSCHTPFKSFLHSSSPLIPSLLEPKNHFKSAIQHSTYHQAVTKMSENPAMKGGNFVHNNTKPPVYTDRVLPLFSLKGRTAIV